MRIHILYQSIIVIFLCLSAFLQVHSAHAQSCRLGTTQYGNQCHACPAGFEFFKGECQQDNDPNSNYLTNSIPAGITIYLGSRFDDIAHTQMSQPCNSTLRDLTCVVVLKDLSRELQLDQDITSVSVGSYDIANVGISGIRPRELRISGESIGSTIVTAFNASNNVVQKFEVIVSEPRMKTEIVRSIELSLKKELKERKEEEKRNLNVSFTMNDELGPVEREVLTSGSHVLDFRIPAQARSCDRGFIDWSADCNRIGKIFLNGSDGFQKNYEYAAKLFERSCTGANSEGCNSLRTAKRLIAERNDVNSKNIQGTGSAMSAVLSTPADSQMKISRQSTVSPQINSPDREIIHLKTESNTAQRNSIGSTKQKLQPSPGVKPPAVCDWEDPNCPPNNFVLCAFDNREIGLKSRKVYKCAPVETIFKQSRRWGTASGGNTEHFAACSRVFNVPLSEALKTVKGRYKFSFNGTFATMTGLAGSHTERHVGADPRALCKAECARNAERHRNWFCESS